MLGSKRPPSGLLALSLTLAAVSFTALVIGALNSRFSVLYSAIIGRIFRSIPLAVSNLTPLPILEVLLYSSPLVIAAIIAYALTRFDEKTERRRRAVRLISMLLLAVSLYVSTLGVSFFKPSEKSSVGTDELISAAEVLVGELARRDAEYIDSADALSEELYLAYLKVQPKNADILPIKPNIKLFRGESLFSSLGIYASYSFLSSEVILNPAAPEYTKPFSAAHECAHLFGISKEDEASLAAYIVLSESDNAAFSYSAQLCALEYILDEIRIKNKAAYLDAVAALPKRVRDELALGESFVGLSGNGLGDASRDLNDAVLSIFDSDGAESYSRFAYLVAEHILSEK